MFVADRPSGLEVARNQAHALELAIADAERARFAQGWHYIGAAGEPGYQNGCSGTVGYYKDSEGFVYLRGTITVPGTGFQTAFTLPVDMRPGKNWNFVDGAGVAGLAARWTVWPSGDAVFFRILGDITVEGHRFRRV